MSKSMHSTDIRRTDSRAGYIYHEGYDDYYEYRRRTPEQEVELLNPLVRQLQRYDTLRKNLEEYGGDLYAVNRITRVLEEKFVLQGKHDNHEVSLTDRKELKRALFYLCYHDYILDVRQLEHTLPVYYLCRIHRSHWSDYSLIVKDVYRSDGYPMYDERFIKLMRGGHESYYLRLSPFRSAVRAMLTNGKPASALDIDDLLLDVGNAVFESAWHEDQRPGILTAEYFDIPHLREAIELLYLCLTSELCELRAKISTPLVKFFETVYPQPGIHRFLQNLDQLSGSDINDLPEQALKLYARLTRAFGQFLQTEVRWGTRQEKVPLYKLIFANFTRVRSIADSIKEHADIKKAADRLDKTAQEIIECI